MTQAIAEARSGDGKKNELAVRIEKSLYNGHVLKMRGTGIDHEKLVEAATALQLYMRMRKNERKTSVDIAPDEKASVDGHSISFRWNRDRWGGRDVPEDTDYRIVVKNGDGITVRLSLPHLNDPETEEMLQGFAQFVGTEVFGLPEQDIRAALVAQVRENAFAGMNLLQ